MLKIFRFQTFMQKTVKIFSPFSSLTKPFISSKIYHPETPLIFKDKTHTPIHINTDAQVFNTILMKSAFQNATPFLAYSLSYLAFGFWSVTAHKITAFGLAAFCVIRCNSMIKIFDRTAKELHVDKNGKELIVVLDRGIKSSFQAFGKQVTQDFEPVLRHTRLTSLYLRFTYEDIEGVEVVEGGNVMNIKARVGKSLFNIRVDMKKHGEEIGKEYMEAIARKERVGV